MSVPLVLLHGWGMQPRVWDELSAALPGRFEVRTPALPGYGNELQSAPTLEEAVEMLASQAPEQIDLVGWSLGGMLALHWAATRPEQVRRLVMISSTPCFLARDDWQSGVPPTMLKMFAMQLRLMPGVLMERFCGLQAVGEAQPDPTALKLFALRAVAPLPTLDGSLSMLERDLRADVARVSQPVLLLHGERDAVVPVAAARWLEGQWPQARLHVFADAGHALPLSRARECAASILAFADE